MKLTKFGALFGTALILVGCNDENPWVGADGEGRISPSVKADYEVKDVVPISRANDPLAPAADNFKISLSKADGTYSESWASISEFPSDKNFSVGAYTMEASYGDIAEEGFEKPYYYGSADFAVKEAETTEVSVTAKLANTMVSIEYTDAFKKYFKSYSTQLHSKGGSYVAFTSTETRPAYIRPGEMSLIVSLTKQNGVAATFEPAVISTLAQHHYHILLDVNEGEVGEATLTINFDDSVEQEDVVIDLSDDLMMSPAPEVTAQGFTVGTPLSILEGSAFENPVRFNIVARGGLSQATLTTQSELLLAQGWPAEIDLMAASEAQQALLKQCGLNVVGMWKNPDKMAMIDFTNVFENVKGTGSHTFTLVVKDKLTKVNDPVSLTVNSEAIDLSIKSAEVSTIGINEASMTLAYNGPDFDKNVTIEAMSYGVYEQCTVLEVNGVTRASSDYAVKFSIPDGNSASVNVRVKYKGEVKDETVITRVAPAYEIQVDAFSNRAVVKVVPEDAAMLETITKMASLYVNNNKVDVTRDSSTGLLTVSGLSQATVYTFKSTVMDGSEGSTYTNTVTATTETATDVTNGGFGSVTRTIDSGTINAGGLYGTTSLTDDKRNKSSIVIDEPNGWASINAKTCYLGASNVNTWFCVPSTLAKDGTVTIRSVAYDHNGTDPEPSHGAATYYSKNAPASFANRNAGELFLGSYAFNGTETRVDGIAFASRPSSLSFDYQYTPYNSESGDVYVALIDADGNVIASAAKTLSSASSMSAVSIPLSGYPFGKKAAKLQIKFRSSTASPISTYVPTGSELKDHNALWFNQTIAANEYKSLSVGSVLVIDNVKLNY